MLEAVLGLEPLKMVMKKGSLRRSGHKEVDGIGCRCDTWYANDDNVIKNALLAWRSCNRIEHINRVALLGLLTVFKQANHLDVQPAPATQGPTQPPTLCGMGNEMCNGQNTVIDALQLEYRQPGRMAHLSLVDKCVGGRQNCMIPR